MTDALLASSLENYCLYPVTFRVQTPFPVLTFPDPSMFEMPTMTFATMVRWYDWFLGRLLAWRNEDKVFYDPMRLACFPSMMPFEQVVSLAQDCAILRRKHNDMCSGIRRSVVQRQLDDASSWRDTLDGALEIVQRIKRLLQARDVAPRSGGIGDLQPEVARFAKAHAHWVEQFREYLGQLLDRGVFDWKGHRFAGDFHGCTLGRELYRRNGPLWVYRSLPEVQKLEAIHKHFHASLMVEAEIAMTLRLQGLAPRELQHVHTQVLNRVNRILQLSDELLATLSLAFQAVEKAQSAGPAAVDALRSVPLSMVLRDMQAWEERVLRMVDRPIDSGIESVLLHTGCPMGKRIVRAMIDPMLSGTWKVMLSRIDEAHMRYHTTGSTIVALAQEGLRLEAQHRIPVLKREGEWLAKCLRSDGQAIGVVA
ncbi:MAG: CZB domain-containing protein [Magnetococcales bacterium]|nr:CZB domain-containing protein [Magnetococcales bacterium]